MASWMSDCLQSRRQRIPGSHSRTLFQIVGHRNSVPKFFPFLCSAVLFGVDRSFRPVKPDSLGILLLVKLFVHRHRFLKLRLSHPFDWLVSRTDFCRPCEFLSFHCLLLLLLSVLGMKGVCYLLQVSRVETAWCDNCLHLPLRSRFCIKRGRSASHNIGPLTALLRRSGTLSRFRERFWARFQSESGGKSMWLWVARSLETACCPPQLGSHYRQQIHRGSECLGSVECPLGVWTRDSRVLLHPLGCSRSQLSSRRRPDHQYWGSRQAVVDLTPSP